MLIVVTRSSLKSPAARLEYRCCFAKGVATHTPLQKTEGDISSVFTSLSGGGAKPLDARFARLKRRLIEGREKEVEESWKRVLRRLSGENQLVAEKVSHNIPKIEFNQIQSPPKEFEGEVRSRGVAIIKRMVSGDEARTYKSEIEDYVRVNPGTRAFPEHAPAVFEL